MVYYVSELAAGAGAGSASRSRSRRGRPRTWAGESVLGYAMLSIYDANCCTYR